MDARPQETPKSVRPRGRPYHSGMSTDLMDIPGQELDELVKKAQANKPGRTDDLTRELICQRRIKRTLESLSEEQVERVSGGAS